MGTKPTQKIWGLGRLGAWLAIGLCFTQFAFATTCDRSLTQAKTPRPYPIKIDPAQTFENLVQHIVDEIITKRGAPGLLVGLSGTDSITYFLAAAEAFKRVGKPDRVAGMHFEENPTASLHQWFQEKILPWLRQKAPHTKIIVDSSIDFRLDGLRWGMLLDWSVFKDLKTRQMRLPADQYWVADTRNKTELKSFTYSNASRSASVALLSHLWKSDILDISEYLGVPKVAIGKSCEVDCVCGRGELAARNIRELDWLLMARDGDIEESFLKSNIDVELRKHLDNYIDNQIQYGKFKLEIPYTVPDPSVAVKDERLLERVENTKKFIAAGANHTRALTKIIPELIANARPEIAADLVSTPSPNRDNWLPEFLALFNTPGLRTSQIKQMIRSIFVPAKVIGPNDESLLANLSARIGYYTFSFTQWRFLAKTTPTKPSLAERFGMDALLRPNDLRDPTAGIANTDRDELGKGFVSENPNWYIEYRRAYIVVSKLSEKQPLTLVIRNSSTIFGRDRLKNVAYVSTKKWTSQELKKIDAQSLETPSFVQWQNIVNATESNAVLSETLHQLDELLGKLDQFNAELSTWLLAPGNGQEELVQYATEKATEQQNKTLATFYIGLVHGTNPSWWPQNVIPVVGSFADELRSNINSLAELQKQNPKLRFVLLTGANGDLP